MPIDIDKYNTIKGTRSTTYLLYYYNGILYNDVNNHSNYYSFGKYIYGYKLLYLSSSVRGKDIMILLSSVWGIEVFIDVKLLQYTSAY